MVVLRSILEWRDMTGYLLAPFGYLFKRYRIQDDFFVRAWLFLIIHKMASNESIGFRIVAFIIVTLLAAFMVAIMIYLNQIKSCSSCCLTSSEISSLMVIGGILLAAVLLFWVWLIVRLFFGRKPKKATTAVVVAPPQPVVTPLQPVQPIAIPPQPAPVPQSLTSIPTDYPLPSYVDPAYFMQPYPAVAVPT